jgi:hypothetical protein
MAASYFGKKAPYGFVMEVTLLYVSILWHYCCSVSFLVHIRPILHLDVYSICFLMQMLLAFALYFPAMRCLFNMFPHFRCLLALNRAVASGGCGGCVTPPQKMQPVGKFMSVQIGINWENGKD